MCPLYVRHSVWETCAQSLATMYANRLDLRKSLENLGFLGDPAAPAPPADASDPLTTIRYTYCLPSVLPISAALDRTTHWRSNG